MKLIQILKENDNYNIETAVDTKNWVHVGSYLLKHCKKFIKESDCMPVYRGVNADSNFIIKKIRKDRKSLYSGITQKFFNGFDDGMREYNLKATRSNSIVCTGSRSFANGYGLFVYVIYLIGDYDYSWSNVIYDYADDYIDFINKNYESISKSGIRKQYGNYSDGKKYFEEVKHTYHTNNLKKAIESKNEILISGDSYCALRIKYWDEHEFKQLTRYLKENV